MIEKRFTHKDKSLYIDNDYFCELEDGDEITELLNRQQYTVETVWKENEQLKQQLNYIQNSISEHIKHQKTELGQKALKEIIEDYNEWLLGHKGSDVE